MIPADDANDAHQEGYADGLAGAGMQDRMSPLTRCGRADWPAIHAATDYITGFELGSIDRRAILAHCPLDAV